MDYTMIAALALFAGLVWLLRRAWREEVRRRADRAIMERTASADKVHGIFRRPNGEYCLVTQSGDGSVHSYSAEPDGSGALTLFVGDGSSPEDSGGKG